MPNTKPKVPDGWRELLDHENVDVADDQAICYDNASYGKWGGIDRHFSNWSYAKVKDYIMLHQAAYVMVARRDRPDRVMGRTDFVQIQHEDYV